MEFSSPQVQALERSLDGFALRHQAIAANLANINTPGYVKQSVNFEQSLLDALNEQSAPHGSISDPFDPNNDVDGFDGFKLNNMWGAQGASVTDGQNHALLTWQPQVVRSGEAAQRLDGNRTPVETEVSEMTQNATKYQAITAVVTKEFGILRTIAQAK